MVIKRSLIVSGTLLVMLLLCAAGLVISINSMLLPVSAGAVDEMIDVNIPPGANAVTIALILAEKGVIHNPLVFRLYARWGDLDKGFIAGDYKLSPSMSLGEIMEKITGGDVYRETAWFTIPEGFTVEQIADRLAANGLAERDRYLDLAARPPDSLTAQFPFLNEVNNANITYALEGYLFPDTYEIKVGATEEEIIALMLRRLDNLISGAGLAQRGRELGLSTHQVLTLASIVEREARVGQERKLIAGVFYNRLATGHPLQSCATVQYVLGEVKEVLTNRDLELNSPYNTYKYPGLPPGPIASPGEASILAAFYPEETGYFYFVYKADGSGEHYFATTLQEHNQNTLKAEQNRRNRG